MQIRNLKKRPPTKLPAAQVFSSPGKLEFCEVRLFAAGATKSVVQTRELYRFWLVLNNFEIVHQCLT
jgi:hypothetical protein